MVRHGSIPDFSHSFHNNNTLRSRGKQAVMGIEREARRNPQIAGYHTRYEWLQKFKECGRKCYYCEVPLAPGFTTKDHLTPLCRGGSDRIDNIVPACKPCNQMKAWRTEDEFW